MSKCNCCNNSIHISRISSHYRKNHYDLTPAITNKKKYVPPFVNSISRVNRISLGDVEADIECIACTNTDFNCTLYPCNHKNVCRKCLWKWWREKPTDDPICPMCRTIVSKVTYNNKNSIILKKLNILKQYYQQQI